MWFTEHLFFVLGILMVPEGEYYSALVMTMTFGGHHRGFIYLKWKPLLMAGEKELNHCLVNLRPSESYERNNIEIHMRT